MARLLDKPDPEQCFTMRKAIRSSNRATIACQDRLTGMPYASLVMMGHDITGAPLFFLSDLADHSKNLQTESTASLLVDTTIGLKTPLTGLRLTINGHITLCQDDALLERYIRDHPDAALYATFKDFNLYRMSMEAVHLVAGFGQIHWFDASSICLAPTDCQTLAQQSADIIDHMNEDHVDAIALIARHYLSEAGIGWSMIDLVSDGFTLTRDGYRAFIPFKKTVRDANAARLELVAMTKKARAALT